MTPPPTADRVILQNCLKLALMREECPVGMPDAQKTALVNKVLKLKNGDLYSPGLLSKFIKVVRGITGHSDVSLNNLFVGCLVNLERERHYTISKGGYLKTNGGFRARGVTLTALGKNQLLTAGAQHGDQMSIDYVDQQYLSNLLLAKKNEEAAINVKLLEKGVHRAMSKEVFHDSIKHLAETKGITKKSAMGAVSVQQRKTYQAIMPETKGSFAAAVLRAHGCDDKDEAALKKVQRKSIAAHGTRSLVIQELWLRDRTLNFSKRHPHLSWNECTTILRDDAIANKRCMHINEDGSYVTAAEQEQYMLNNEVDMYGPTALHNAPAQLPAPTPAASGSSDTVYHTPAATLPGVQ